jgi:hypothetical protein
MAMIEKCDSFAPSRSNKDGLLVVASKVVRQLQLQKGRVPLMVVIT